MTAVAIDPQTMLARDAAVSDILLDWYDRERRDLPWRSPPGEAADPYAVWLSEVMLQQTTVKAVIPYYEKFLRRWPSVGDLAAAEEEEVLAAWAGLGYYSRARNLYLCAKTVCAEHAGRFPEHEDQLLTLPGIGPYTAAAIAAIAFGKATTPVDGNVERVVARLFNVTTPLPAGKPELKAKATTLTPSLRAGDFAQAMMDLGATICSPKRPSCLMCPLQQRCGAHLQGLETTLPRRTAKPDRPVRFGVAFLALSESGSVLLRRRPDEGLLARMLEVPSTEWTGEWPSADAALRLAPIRESWWPVPGMVQHTFTHFRLELLVYRAVVPDDVSLTIWAEASRCRWVPRRDLHAQALPSVMRKVIAHGLDDDSY